MDNPSLGQLRELTGDGTQTILGAGVASGAVDFYRVDFILDTQLSLIYIQDLDHSTTFSGSTCKAGTSIYNVTKITADSGLLIGFTAPDLTGQIEP